MNATKQTHIDNEPFTLCQLLTIEEATIDNENPTCTICKEMRTTTQDYLDYP